MGLYYFIHFEMNGPIRSNLPPRTYAAKKDKPRLCQQIEEALTNKYGVEMLELEKELARIDNYYIKCRDTHYQGNWFQGMPHGKGRAIYPDGSYYIGNFKDGEAEDEKGILFFPNGAYYQGNVRKSKLEGKGRLIHKNAYLYEGEWFNNKPHGEGRELIPEEGIEYVGQFVEGQKHCCDLTRDIKSKKDNPPVKMAHYRRGKQQYKGEFCNGRMHGYGELTNPDKKLKYKGEFINGQKEGYGTLETEQGTLTGTFHKDVINGDGIFRWRDGRAYEGQFKNNKFDGVGTVTFPEGNSLSGTWKDGQSESLRAVFGTMQAKKNDDIFGMFTSVKMENSKKQNANLNQNESHNTGNIYAKEYAKEQNRHPKEAQLQHPIGSYSEGQKGGLVESQTHPISNNNPNSSSSHPYSGGHNFYTGNQNPYSGNSNPYSGNNTAGNPQNFKSGQY